MTPDGTPMTIDEEPGVPEPRTHDEQPLLVMAREDVWKYGRAKGSTAELRARLKHACGVNEQLVEQIGQLRREINALKLAAEAAK